MVGRLKNKVAVITGGTSGIGEVTAELFISEGANVVICGRSEMKGRAIADRLGNACKFIVADVMSEADIKKTIDFAADEFGGIDILFNNAGGPTAGDIIEVDEDTIHYAMQLLFSSAVLGIKHVVPHMRARGGGSIINNSSVAAIRDNQGGLLYSAAKAALTHYTTLAGVRLGPDGIRVNCISPGAIATPIFYGGSARANTLSDDQNAAKMEKLAGNLARATPMQKTGLPIDIATGALYLASDEGRFVNSHDLVIDGGRTAMFHEAQ
ncbi:MAG: NAD(P)-dependent dehydrogenase (short-subunit alcohol dehydrogenase family) [Candidatus Azotimanducaceae bacterium]|jgi:NAD(P)-dependent dehydrogenase (short-subunit alcohol dehydrogenase family)